jgi:hypothetical protein
MYQLQTVPKRSNQLQLTASDTPDKFNIASSNRTNEAFSSIFCKHPHSLILLICFKRFVIFKLQPLVRDVIKIIPYV